MVSGDRPLAATNDRPLWTNLSIIMDSGLATWHGDPVSELNATAAALLGLLHDGPKTGGQLIAEAAARFGAFFSVTRSQVYRELPVLTKANLLKLGKQGPRSSQQYLITPAGKKAFKTWLATSPGPDHLRSPLILRLAFADSFIDKQRETLAAAARNNYLAQHEEYRAATKSVENRRDRAIAEFAATYTKAMAKLVDSLSAG